MKPSATTTAVIGAVVLAGVLLGGGDKPQPIVVLNEESLFAEVDAQGSVLRVIVADQSFIDSGAVGDPKNWIQTSSKGTIRKNYAGTGYKYDKTIDAFVPPKTAETTVFNAEKAVWEYPVLTETIQVATSSEI